MAELTNFIFPAFTGKHCHFPGGNLQQRQEVIDGLFVKINAALDSLAHKSEEEYLGKKPEMKEMYNDIAALQNIEEIKPQFVVIIKDGLLVNISMLNGQGPVPYLFIDEDAIEISQEDFDDDTPTNEIIRRTLTTTPQDFLQYTEAVSDATDLYQPPPVSSHHPHQNIMRFLILIFALIPFLAFTQVPVPSIFAPDTVQTFYPTYTQATANCERSTATYTDPRYRKYPVFVTEIGYHVFCLAYDRQRGFYRIEASERATVGTN